ncbi:MAG: M23 family metallopeptidase [Gemmatimonadales bacterium]|nr:M23 family metallopeptidase [Gemmatimonadales bacterium]
MRWLRVAIPLAVITAAAGLALTGRWPWRRLEVAAPPPVALIRPLQESADTLRRGETLGDLFDRRGLPSFDLVALLERTGLDPRRLRAGLVVHFKQEAGDSVPSMLSVRTGPEERLAARRLDDAWRAERQPVAWTKEIVRIEGPIDNSLYEALDARIPDELLDAGNRVRLAWDLADVYAWSIDFNRDIQLGDRFAVMIEREVSELGEVRSGNVLAADLLVSGKHLTAYRFEPVGSSARYYDAEGNSLRRAFLRAPVEFRRISSSFSRSRLHPVLGIWRRHEGTDYSAGSGTPVLASGDGVVLQAGRAGGYGNLVELRHMNGITTRYGHLRGFARGVRAGSRVSQGDVIGYVGATGLASAAHLHYEFRINGVARDSRRVELGNGKPIERSLLALYTQERDRLALVLGVAGQPTVARAE